MISAEPEATAVTSPLLFTVAMVDADEFQVAAVLTPGSPVTVAVTSCV